MTASPRAATSRRVLVGGALTAAVSMLAACSATGSDAPRVSAAARISAAQSPWPGAAVVRDGDVVVRGTASQARLHAVAAAAQQAIAQVRAVWGAEVLRGQVVVEVPATQAQFRARGGSAEAGAQIAATTTRDDRVVLAPVIFTEVTAQGRLVVLTHELTHVALQQARLTSVAHWIVEGSAEFTAYHASALGLAQLAPAIAVAVRAGRSPAGPPDDADFAAQPAAAYQGAYVWCRFLVARSGLGRFVAFVRAADAGRPGAFVEAFGATTSALRAPYGRYLRVELARSAGAS